MRRGAGISALSRQSASTASYASLSTSLSANQVHDLRAQLESFRNVLLEFSTRHREEIRKDPALRHQFQKMCAGLGIDPLASTSAVKPRARLLGSTATTSSTNSSGKGKAAANALGGLWQELFSTISDWEYELALQIVDVCVSTRARNGGMIGMEELIRRVSRLRRGQQGGGASGGAEVEAGAGAGAGAAGGEEVITSEDVERAIKALAPLEAGYEVVRLDHGQQSSSPSGGGKTYIRSVASELGIDQAILIGLASDPSSSSSSSASNSTRRRPPPPPRGRLDERLVSRHLGWTPERTRSALEIMVKRDGLGWVDEQADADEGGGYDEGYRDVIVGDGWTVWVPSVMEWEDA